MTAIMNLAAAAALAGILLTGCSTEADETTTAAATTAAEAETTTAAGRSCRNDRGRCSCRKEDFCYDPVSHFRHDKPDGGLY